MGLGRGSSTLLAEKKDGTDGAAAVLEMFLNSVQKPLFTFTENENGHFLC